jgi:hypothetical protein
MNFMRVTLAMSELSSYCYDFDPEFIDRQRIINPIGAQAPIIDKFAPKPDFNLQWANFALYT